MKYCVCCEHYVGPSDGFPHTCGRPTGRVSLIYGKDLPNFNAPEVERAPRGGCGPKAKYFVERKKADVGCWILRIAGVLVILLVVLILSGCALFPPSAGEVSSDCNGKVKAVNTSDRFSWRFLGFSVESTRRAECSE